MFTVKMASALTYIIILISFIFTFIFSSPFTFMAWLNTLFVVSLIFLLVGCVMLVAQSGFFDLFIFNFKKLWRKNDKAEELVREVEGKSTANTSFEKKERAIHPFTKVIAVSGLFLVMLSIFLSYTFSS